MKKLKSSSFIIIIMSVVILLLLGLSCYLFNESRKPDYKIAIGTYTNKYGDRLISYPISNKEDYRAILFALINANSIEEPAIISKLPDASILISDSKQGVGYLDADVWFAEDKVIFNLGEKNNIDSNYKVINGEYAKYINEFISKYKPENNFD
ncbi:hypothetical protein [Clostridium tertium]|uniref:Uncharacterized protein n=1 Tax=Clostridium tertium TaxID=1559 RepID=A0A6N3FBN2_9CLOT